MLSKYEDLQHRLRRLTDDIDDTLCSSYIRSRTSSVLDGQCSSCTKLRPVQYSPQRNSHNLPPTSYSLLRMTPRSPKLETQRNLSPKKSPKIMWRRSDSYNSATGITLVSDPSPTYSSVGPSLPTWSMQRSIGSQKQPERLTSSVHSSIPQQCYNTSAVSPLGVAENRRTYLHTPAASQSSRISIKLSKTTESKKNEDILRDINIGFNGEMVTSVTSPVSSYTNADYLSPERLTGSNHRMTRPHLFHNNADFDTKADDGDDPRLQITSPEAIDAAIRLKLRAERLKEEKALARLKIERRQIERDISMSLLASPTCSRYCDTSKTYTDNDTEYILTSNRKDLYNKTYRVPTLDGTGLRSGSLDAHRSEKGRLMSPMEKYSSRPIQTSALSPMKPIRHNQSSIGVQTPSSLSYLIGSSSQTPAVYSDRKCDSSGGLQNMSPERTKLNSSIATSISPNKYPVQNVTASVIPFDTSVERIHVSVSVTSQLLHIIPDDISGKLEIPLLGSGFMCLIPFTAPAVGKAHMSGSGCSDQTYAALVVGEKARRTLISCGCTSFSRNSNDLHRRLYFVWYSQWAKCQQLCICHFPSRIDLMRVALSLEAETKLLLGEGRSRNLSSLTTGRLLWWIAGGLVRQHISRSQRRRYSKSLAQKGPLQVLTTEKVSGMYRDGHDIYHKQISIQCPLVRRATPIKRRFILPEKKSRSTSTQPPVS